MNIRTNFISVLLRTVVIVLCGAYAAAGPYYMKLTTVRESGARKDWTTDSVRVLVLNKNIKVIGYFPTGRTEPGLEYQKMWIDVDPFVGKQVYVGPQLRNSFWDDIFSGGGKTDLVPTDFVGGEVNITDFDVDELVVKGTFNFSLTSKPINLDQQRTSIVSADFVAHYTDAISLEAKTSKTPVPARAGEKAKAVQILATNNANLPVKGVKISVTNPLDKNQKEEIGITDDKGSVIYRFDIKDDAKSDDYTLLFDGQKKNYKDPKQVSKVVRVSSRYWSYKCGGLDLITFDAGEGKEFKKVNDVSKLIESTSDIISVNDILKIQGKLIIDPTAGQEQVRVEGDLVFENIPLPPSGALGSFKLSTGSHTILPNCDNFLKYQISQKAKTKIGNYEISLDELAFTDNGITQGLKVKGSLKWEGSELESKECNKSDVPNEKSISFGMTLTSGGIEEVVFGASNLTCKYIPHVCLNEFGVKYNWLEDAFVINGFAQINKMVGTAKMKGAYASKGGKFDSLYVELSTDCKPVPDTPLCIDGGKLTLEKWASTTWKDQAVKVIASFKTDEQVIKDRFPIVKALFDKVGLAAWEVGGKWQFPRKFSVINTAKLFKDEFISVTKPWQVELSQGPCEIDLDKGFKYSYGSIKAGHFGADDYFITADAGTATMTWNPTLSLEISNSAKIRIPNIPDVAPKGAFRTWLEGAKATGSIPQDLGQGKIYLNLSETTGIKFEAFVDVSANKNPWINRLGKAYFTMANQTGSWTFSFGSGLASLSGISYRKGNEIQRSRTIDDQIVMAVPLDTFQVAANTEKVIILISGQTTAPVPHLYSPSGTKYDDSTPDQTISFVSGGPKVKMISLDNPAAGKWVLALDNPSATDSVSIIGTQKPKQFSISAKQAARVVTVSWDPSNYVASDSVRIFLDNNNSGDDGTLIGAAAASVGKFNYTMTDSLAECEYYLYARPIVSGQVPDAVYATDIVTVAKTILAPPTNINVSSNERGESLVQWKPSPASNVSFYIVSVKSSFGTDSTIAMVPKDELEARIKVDTLRLRGLHVSSSNFDGMVGCPGIPELITVEVEEDGSALVSESNPLVVIPNPTAHHANLSFALRQSAQTTILIVNTLGQIMTEINAGYISEGSHSIQCNTSSLPNGMYTVRVLTAGHQLCTTMSVVH